MYAWIEKDLIVDTETVVAVVGADEAGRAEMACRAVRSNGRVEGNQRTIIFLRDGRCLPTKVGRETVTRKLVGGIRERNRGEEVG